MKELWRLPVDKPHVFRTFLRHSGLSTGNAMAALTPSLYPEIVLRDLDLRRYGRFEGGNIIYLNSILMWQIEEAARLRQQRPQLHMLVESKILHEMIHWAYYKIHLEFDKGPEIGWLFEEAAYGMKVTITSLGISRDFVDLPQSY